MSRRTKPSGPSSYSQAVRSVTLGLVEARDMTVLAIARPSSTMNEALVCRDVLLVEEPFVEDLVNHPAQDVPANLQVMIDHLGRCECNGGRRLRSGRRGHPWRRAPT